MPSNPTFHARPLARAAVLAAVCALSPAAPVRAATGETAAEREAAREVLLRLDRRLGAITSLRGKFVQTFTSAGLGVPQAESGRFALKRPNLLRWDYAEPERKTAISDGVHTWLHVPEDGVVYRGSVAAWRQGSAFAVLTGGGLAEEWDADGVDAVSAVHRGNVVLRLLPRSSREDLVEMLVELDPSDLSIAAVTAVDGMANRIAVAFTDVEENSVIPADLFRFTPPPGARIVDQEPPLPPP